MDWKSLLLFVAVMAFWIFLMAYVLPKAGVST